MAFLEVISSIFFFGGRTFGRFPCVFPAAVPDLCYNIKTPWKLAAAIHIEGTEPYMKQITITKDDSGQRLDKFMEKAFPLLPRSLHWHVSVRMIPLCM